MEIFSGLFNDYSFPDVKKFCPTRSVAKRPKSVPWGRITLKNINFDLTLFLGTKSFASTRPMCMVDWWRLS